MNDKNLLTRFVFVRKFVASLLVVGAIFLLARRSERAAIALESIAGRFHLKIIAFAHQQQASILLGLLASSCCALQLLLGALSIGCAGFNVVLGPIRPPLLAVAVAVQAWMWSEALRENGRFRFDSCVTSSSLCAALALLPEILAWRLNSNAAGGEIAAAVAAAAPSGGDDVGRYALAYSLEGMGCIACATTVSSVAQSVCGAEAEVKVDLDGAIVRVAGKIRAGGRDPARVGASLAAKLEEAGFPATRIGDHLASMPAFQGGRRVGEPILLNVYDLSPHNDTLLTFGLGAFHTGIEAFGTEYSFSDAGVSESSPKQAGGARFRESIELGTVQTRGELGSAISRLRDEFAPGSYDVVRRNCNNFSTSLAFTLLKIEIPGWVNRLAAIGACCRCLIPDNMVAQTPGSTGSGGSSGSVQPTMPTFGGKGFSLGGSGSSGGGGGGSSSGYAPVATREPGGRAGRGGAGGGGGAGLTKEQKRAQRIAAIEARASRTKAEHSE